MTDLVTSANVCPFRAQAATIATVSVMTEWHFLDATRTFYDSLACTFARQLNTDLASKPLDRAMLSAFAECVKTANAGPVADLGCGSGHVTSYLDGLGLSVFGVDLSPAMVAMARQTYPRLLFEEGTYTALNLADSSLGGIVALYSIIHTPSELLPSVLVEFSRVLCPGGYLLLAFQVGDKPLRITEPGGHPVSLDFNRWPPDHVADLLNGTGLTVQAQLLREPTETEGVQQAYLLARCPQKPSLGC